MYGSRSAGAVVLVLIAGEAWGQDIEPRRWTHLPVGTNIAGAGYIYTDGDLHVDPVLEIQDASLSLHTFAVSYNRYFDVGGMTGRLDLELPVQDGRWHGLLSGVPTTVRRDGLADPRLRLSVGFLGSPALDGAAYLEHLKSRDDHTLAGAALAVRVPLGEYMDDKLINLGENRFSFQPQLGFVRFVGDWSFEVTASAFLYTDNTDFYGGKRLEQDPLYAVQVHVVRTFDSGLWFSAGAAYGGEGETEIDGVSRDDDRSNLLVGASVGFSPIEGQGLRVGYFHRDALDNVGLDAHNVLLTWALRF